jgi:hypothetical protein
MSSYCAAHLSRTHVSMHKGGRAFQAMEDQDDKKPTPDDFVGPARWTNDTVVFI